MDVATFPTELLLKCWFLAGPTASGKTAASLELAERIHGEIVAMDSMTLYRGMDIGTAKPTSSEQSRVRHHLVNLIDPRDEFSVAEYISAATQACLEITARGHVPLFTGGTGLYLRGLLRGVFQGPAADWSIRRRLEETARSAGPGSLHERLTRVDVETARRLHPNDERRVIRALEVFELTGQPLSVFQNHGPKPIDQRPHRVYWLSPPRDWLYRRIDARVDQMFADGLVQEVRNLVEHHGPLSHTARQGLGYKEVIDWSESGLHCGTSHPADSGEYPPVATLNELIELIKTRTRQFAKRQHTWFRNLDECHAVPLSGDESPGDVAQAIIRMSER